VVWNSSSHRVPVTIWQTNWASQDRDRVFQEPAALAQNDYLYVEFDGAPVKGQHRAEIQIRDEAGGYIQQASQFLRSDVKGPGVQKVVMLSRLRQCIGGDPSLRVSLR